MLPPLLHQYGLDREYLFIVASGTMCFMRRDMMTPNPHFRPPVLGRDIHQADIDHLREREIGGVCEFTIRMHRLPAVRRRS